MKTILKFLAAALALGVSCSFAQGVPPGLAKKCTVTAAPMAFGNYEAAQAAPLDMAGSLQLQCPRENLSITLSLNAGVSGNANARAMARGIDRLQYQIYTDAGRTNAFIADRAHNVASRESFELSIYGRIFASQDVTPGIYSDSLTVTLLP